MGKKAVRRKRPPTPKPEAKHPAEVESESISPEVLEKLPAETRVAYLESISFKGPLHPPALFQSYEKILPGAAERIMRLAEREQTHRQGWEMSVLKARGSDNRRGRWLGFGIAVLSITSTVIGALLDKLIIAIASLVPVAAGILTSVFGKTPPESNQEPAG